MSRHLNKVTRLAAGLVPMALALSASAACAGNVGVDVNIHLGNQPRQVIVPAPVAPLPLQVVSIDQDVHFVYPERLGFFVAVGVPYDLFYLQNSYYLCRDGRWFRAPGSHGPWVAAQYRDLPPGLRRHKLDRIREYRRAEYDVYRHDRDRYEGKHFMTGKDEWKAYRKEEKEDRKVAKREDKEYRKEMKRAEKEDRKAEKEERKQRKGGKHDND